jgi:hypothetical protein
MDNRKFHRGVSAFAPSRLAHCKPVTIIEKQQPDSFWSAFRKTASSIALEVFWWLIIFGAAAAGSVAIGLATHSLDWGQ